MGGRASGRSCQCEDPGGSLPEGPGMPRGHGGRKEPGAGRVACATMTVVFAPSVLGVVGGFETQRFSIQLRIKGPGPLRESRQVQEQGADQLEVTAASRWEPVTGPWEGGGGRCRWEVGPVGLAS